MIQTSRPDLSSGYLHTHTHIHTHETTFIGVYKGILIQQ